MTADRAVALGEAPADLLLRGGRIFRPEAREFVRADLAVAGGRVAAQFEDGTPVESTDEQTTVLDVDGRHVVPGFIDAHTHVDTYQTVETAYHHLLAGGTTGLVAEVSGFQAAFGAEGIEAVLAATADLPLAVRVVVSPIPLVETFEPRHPTDVARLCDLLARPRVCGVGEVPWIHLLADDGGMGLLERSRREGKPVSAHGAGCRGQKLQALAAMVDNDHEAVTAADFLDRLAAGIHPVARSGSIRDDVPAFAEAYQRRPEAIAAECSLCTDGMWPGAILADGYVNEVVRRVIEAGVDPVDALGMATLNPARRFGFDRRGTLAPGSVADAVVLEDLESVAVGTVVAAGEVVVRDGEPLVGPRSHDYPDRFAGPVDVAVPDDLCEIPVSAASDGSVRAIEHRGGLLTAETTVAPAVIDGSLAPDPAGDVLEVVHVDRHPAGDGEAFAGFLTGFGLDRGAAATTITWDTPSIVGVGADRADLRAAVERLTEVGGGWTVIEDGDVVTEFATPLGARCSARSLADSAARMRELRTALADRGTSADRPLLAIQTLTFAGVPALKLSRSGYADIDAREVVGLSPG
ncbi:MAG: adenine deaminase C-terminal domain-containing protein [Salinirussus sp.]